MKKLTVVAIAYVALSNAILLALHSAVIALDIRPDEVAALYNQRPPKRDEQIPTFLHNQPRTSQPTLGKGVVRKNADSVLVATPTDYDDETNTVPTTSVESGIEEVTDMNTNAIII